jgi:hypothetical protein
MKLAFQTKMSYIVIKKKKDEKNENYLFEHTFKKNKYGSFS